MSIARLLFCMMLLAATAFAGKDEAVPAAANSLSPRNLVFVSPFCGYAFVNYNKKVDVLDLDGKSISNRPGDLIFPLVDLIRRSQKTIDIACYLYGTLTWEHQEILKANARGVKIRLFLDTSIKDKDNVPVVYETIEQLKEVRPRILVKVIDPEKAEKMTGIPFQTMHEKFGIFDRLHAFNGSANIEPGSNIKYTEDRFFFLDNPEMALVFQEEFDRLWDGMGQYLLPPDEGVGKK
ncbi:MAG: phospholipase D family protein [Candidatus Aureabacteria bacterium]|nr:phospholipase D family protein [Candidatus Auribacterota bacterium]